MCGRCSSPTSSAGLGHADGQHRQPAGWPRPQIEGRPVPWLTPCAGDSVAWTDVLERRAVRRHRRAGDVSRAGAGPGFDHRAADGPRPARAGALRDVAAPRRSRRLPRPDVHGTVAASEVEKNPPSAAYLAMLVGGLREAYGWSYPEIAEYLAPLPGVQGTGQRRRSPTWRQRPLLNGRTGKRRSRSKAMGRSVSWSPRGRPGPQSARALRGARAAFQCGGDFGVSENLDIRSRSCSSAGLVRDPFVTVPTTAAGGSGVTARRVKVVLSLAETTRVSIIRASGAVTCRKSQSLTGGRVNVG